MIVGSLRHKRYEANTCCELCGHSYQEKIQPRFLLMEKYGQILCMGESVCRLSKIQLCICFRYRMYLHFYTELLKTSGNVFRRYSEQQKHNVPLHWLSENVNSAAKTSN